MRGPMNKILIAIGAVIGIVLLVWVVFVDIIIERAIEREGTRAIGARVELDGAHLSLLPPGLTLDRVQVTNPDSPMTNAVEVDRISATVDLGLLIRKKVRIPEMTVDRVRFSTPRKSSGAVAGGKGAKTAARKAPAMKMPSLDFPNPKEILKNERLESIELANSLKAEMESARKQWSAELERVLDRKKLDEFRKRAESLRGASEGGPLGMIGAATEAASLQKDVTAYIDGMKETNKRLTSEVDSFKKRVKDVQSAPARDIKRLKEKYSITAGGLENLSALVLGDQISGLTGKAVYWYERLMPIIADARAGKKDAPAKAKTTRPGDTTADLSVDHAAVSVELAAGRIAGEARNISSGPGVPAQPATFSFSGTKLDGMESVKVDGRIDRTNPDAPADSARVVVTGYRARGVALSKAESMPITLSEATVDLDVTAGLKGKGEASLMERRLDAAVDAGFGKARISATPAEGAHRVAGVLADTLSGVDRFRIKAAVDGTLDDYKIHLSSDLDRVLGQAVGKSIASIATKFEGELKDSVLAKARGPMGELGGGIKGLEGFTKDIEGRLTESSGILGTIGRPDSSGERPEPGAPIKLPGGIKLPF